MVARKCWQVKNPSEISLQKLGCDLNVGDRLHLNLA